MMQHFLTSHCSIRPLIALPYHRIRSALLLTPLSLLLSACLFSTQPLSPPGPSERDGGFVGQWYVEGEEDDILIMERGSEGLIALIENGPETRIHLTSSHGNLYANMIENPADHWLILKVTQPGEEKLCFANASGELIEAAISTGALAGAITEEGFSLFKWSTPVISDAPQRLLAFLDNTPELFTKEEICYLKKGE